MKRILIAALAVLALAGGAVAAFGASDPEDETCAFADGTFADGMASRVVRTLRTGFWDVEYAENSDVAEVSVSLEHVLLPGWNCATWSAEILTPDDLSVVGAASRTGLTRADEVTFLVEIVDQHREDGGLRAIDMDRYEVREHLAILALAVQNGDASNVHVDGTANDGRGRWHYPVSVLAHRP